MTKLSTGFLELSNLAASVKAADQMLKAAEIESIRKINLGQNGYVLVITGDAPSVEAALIAGETSAKNSASFLNRHIVDSLDPAIQKFFPGEAE